MNCSYEWIGIGAWWSRLDAGSQAAWVQAIGSVIAILVAVLITFWQRRQEARDRETGTRKLALRLAFRLNSAIEREAGYILYVTAKLGTKPYEELLQRSIGPYCITKRLIENLSAALDRLDYFDDDLCVAILDLERVTSNYYHMTNSWNAEATDSSRLTSLRMGRDYLPVVLGQMHKVSDKLQHYLPLQLRRRSRDMQTRMDSNGLETSNEGEEKHCQQEGF